MSPALHRLWEYRRCPLQLEAAVGDSGLQGAGWGGPTVQEVGMNTEQVEANAEQEGTVGRPRGALHWPEGRGYYSPC